MVRCRWRTPSATSGCCTGWPRESGGYCHAGRTSAGRPAPRRAAARRPRCGPPPRGPAHEFAESDGEPYQTALPFDQVADEVFATAGGSPGSDDTGAGPDRTGAEDEDPGLRAWLAAETGRPFDLAAGRVFRVRVSRRGPREHVLLCAVHHIVADGWSLDLLVEEVLRRYAAVAAGGRPEVRPDPALRYRDYAVWQHALDDGPAFAYWRDRLAGRRPCAARRPSRYWSPVVAASARRTVPAAVLARLRDLCEAERTTTFVGILAAFQTLLHRYTSATDLVVGVPLAGRSRPELQDVVGCFVNTVPLRGNLEGRPFRDVVRRARTTVREALDHQDVPFDRIATRLGIDRSAPFDTMLAYQRRLPARGRRPHREPDRRPAVAPHIGRSPWTRPSRRTVSISG